MQLTRGNFIEKILPDATGRLVRVTFCLYEHKGRIKARIVSVQTLKESPESQPLVLCGYTQTSSTSSEVFNSYAIVSPYVATNPLYVSGSKPRAPTI